MRRLVHEADPDITEDCKWVKPSNPLGVPVWSHAGIVSTGEAYKQVVKLTFKALIRAAVAENIRSSTAKSQGRERT